ncbi:MAG: hypothetical protein GXP35_10345 [Actinobacteria bacterium]|nr:hypothetical protein [Actinomycetota bacterium]
MGDKEAKEKWAGIEAPVFDETAFTKPPPLDQATVAVVTTASLHHGDQDGLDAYGAGYSVLDGSRRDYVSGHYSPLLDLTGFAYDMNVVFPLDRLDELAADGVIGAVADRHLSYNGIQLDLSSIRLDSGPAGAKWLKEQGVDVVLLTPI